MKTGPFDSKSAVIDGSMIFSWPSRPQYFHLYSKGFTFCTGTCSILRSMDSPGLEDSGESNCMWWLI